MNTTLITLLAVLMILVGIGFIYFVVRENERPLPRGGVQWAATVLSLLLIFFSGLLLVLTLLPGGRGSFDIVAAGGLSPDELDKPATDFSFRMVGDDREGTLASYEGKVVLLNFWATWCPPCIAELPDLNRLQENYGAKGLVVITVSDERREELIAFEEQMPLRTVSAYLTDAGALPEPFRRTLAAGRPTTYLIDREGYIRFHVLGAGNYAYFEQILLPYLTEDRLAAR